MLFDAIMFTENESMKLTLFREITKLSPGIYRIEEVMGKCQLNYHQLTNLLSKIDSDLAQHWYENQSILRTGGHFEVSRTLPQVDEYRAICLEVSIPFQFLLAIINQTAKNTAEFCSRWGIARSTMARKLSPLISYLKTFHLSFSHADLKIVGKEKVIRVVLFHLLWVGYRGNKWAFREVSYEKIKKMISPHIPVYNFGQSKLVFKEEIILLFAINQTRYLQGYMAAEDEALTGFFRASAHFSYDDFLLLDYANENDRARELNFVFLELFLLSFLHPLDSPHLREDRRAFLEIPQYKWCLSVVRSLILFLRQENVVELSSQKELNLFQSECLRQAIKLTEYKTMPSSIEWLKLETRTQTQGLLQVKELLKKFFHQVVKKGSPFFYSQTNEASFISAFEHIIYEESVKKQRLVELIHIGVAIEETFAYTQLKLLLADIRMVEMQDYERDKRYDLVIHGPTFITPKDAEQAYFHLELNYDDEDLDRLTSLIFRLYRDKIMK